MGLKYPLPSPRGKIIIISSSGFYLAARKRPLCGQKMTETPKSPGSKDSVNRKVFSSSRMNP